MCANSSLEGQYFYQVIPVSFEMAELQSAKQGDEGALLPCLVFIILYLKCSFNTFKETTINTEYLSQNTNLKCLQQ